MFHQNYKFNHNFPQLARESNFNFREPNANNTIDWRWIGSLDVERILTDKDFDRIEATFSHVTDISLGILLNNSLLDPAVGKYFTVSQLCIQYLIFCVQFLDKAVVEMRMASIEGQKEIQKLQKLCKKRDNELLQLHKKFQRTEIQQKTVYPCTKCTKNFVSYEMLNVHLTRKHGNNDIETLPINRINNPGDDANLINTIKLELEIKQLKEKLNITERELIEKRKNDDVIKCNCCENTKLKQKKFHNIGIQNNLEEMKDKDESEEIIIKKNDNQNLINLNKLFTKQEELLENWKKSEQLKYENEMKLLRKKLTDTIDEFKIQTKQLVEKETNLKSIEQVDRKNNDDVDDVWKDRFIKLEKIYFENQDVMFRSLKDLDFKYNETMKNIEKQKIIEKSKEIQYYNNNEFRSDSLNRSNILSRDKSINESSSIESSIEDEEEPDDENQFKCKENPLKGKDSNKRVVVKENERKAKDINTVEKTKEIEREKIAEKNKEVKENNETKINQNVNIEKLLSKNISKPIIRPTSIIKSTKNSSLVKDQRPKNQIKFETTKQDIERMYSNRLRELGINPDWKDLTAKKMNAALSQLAQKREHNKKKYKTFFITRNKISKIIEQAAKEILVPKEIIKSKIPVSKVIRKKDTPIITSIEIIEEVKSSVDPVDFILVPPKPLLRTKTFVIQEKPTTSTPIQSPVSRISNIDDESSGEITDDIEIGVDLLIKPKPVPRKRVIFDLEKKNNPESKTNFKLEDVSDWEISSFNSDK